MIDAHAYLGRLIGGYRFVAEISTSPVHCVYRGEHSAQPGHPVAITLWQSIHLTPQKQAHFLQEGRVLKMLKHPHLLAILDSGIHEHMPYLVTEYASRGSLRDRIKRQSPRSVPIQETLIILSQVGQALQYAHQLNLTHGNLTPESILFTTHGDALLTGLTPSTLLEEAGRALTHTISSARYMAPEQFHGTTSPASDQYALGCIGYELLTGQVPFSAVDCSALAEQHATQSPLALTQLNLLLPLYIEEAILKALAKRQAARHVSVKDFLAALGPAPVFCARLLPPTVWPHAALPALSSFQSPTRLTSTADPLQEIGQQQAEEDTFPGEPERTQAPPDTQWHIALPVPVTPEPLEAEEEEQEHHEEVRPLVAPPAEACGDGAKSRQGYIHTETEQPDVSEQDTASSPVIEAPHPQSSSRALATLPMMVVDSRAEAVTRTHADATWAISPVSQKGIGRSQCSGTQGSRYLWLTVTLTSIIIAAILVALSSFAFPVALSTRTTAHLAQQTPGGAAATGSLQVPSPLPSAPPSPQPSPEPTAASQPHPTPTPRPRARPTPTPASAPTPGLVATPSQFYAENDCPSHGPWYTCIAILAVSQSQHGTLAWSVSSSGLDRVSFNPSAGVLSPGQQQQVIIRVRGDCPMTGSLTFSGGGSTLTVPWSC